MTDELAEGADGLIVSEGETVRLFKRCDGAVMETPLSDSAREMLSRVKAESDSWLGQITEDGDYLFDPRTPSPGTHFRANLLLGDRAGFSYPLMMTSKACVDEWGCGSSRFHADKQMLATRWDQLPEENGFPANRQFYLVEDGRQIFYSAAPGPDTKVLTRHAVNHTVISCLTADGLSVERTIFVVPARPGVTCGMEQQIVTVKNVGSRPREIDIVVTGMLGFPHPEALSVDVIYTCVTVRPRVIGAGERGLLAVTPEYTPSWGSDDRPFHLTAAYGPEERLIGAGGYTLDYTGFIGNGTLENPENLCSPDNEPARKGPAFFALTFSFDLEPEETGECHSVTGMISNREGEPVTEAVMLRQLGLLAEKLTSPNWGRMCVRQVREYQEEYQGAVQVRTPDTALNRLLNFHLPFQIRYQTYASRSFGLTQKGYRQIGFREIQDLFAAMPFELAARGKDYVIGLIGEWAGNVYRFGYANHQFYWTGHGPGTHSDDPLWLFQAVGRYTDLTGDESILDAEWPMAGEEASRPLYETLQSILNYCGRFSVGRNGLPIIDSADWNDTLSLDENWLNGPAKEAEYRKQLADGAIREGESLQSELSESVMNGFLLEIARDYMVRFARMKGDAETEGEWSRFGDTLRARLAGAWRNDFFARALINRPNEAGITYLGAAGDGMSDDSSLPGTYFLNSFSWSVLSGVATDEQIGVMLDRMEAVLLTPVGLRLSSPARFRVLMPGAGSGDYAYGDRENGGIFKHANMMAVFALLKAARTVADAELAERLASLGWRVLMLTAPFAPLDDPYVLRGNPRFCTQYTNPATEEHVGPLLSGTAPWMWMAWLSTFGVDFREGQLVLDPVLPPEWESVSLDLSVPAGRFRIAIRKPPRFVRSREAGFRVKVDGEPRQDPLPPFDDGVVHLVEASFD